MKILKLKSILFSLMAITMITVFLTSCEEKNLAENTHLNTELEGTQLYVLPNEFDDMTSEQLKTHLDDLSEQEILSLETISIDDKIEERCGTWKDITYYTTCRVLPYNYCFYGYKRATKLQRQKRWCGPPTNGGYDYRWAYKSCCW